MCNILWKTKERMKNAVNKKKTISCTRAQCSAARRVEKGESTVCLGLFRSKCAHFPGIEPAKPALSLPCLPCLLLFRGAGSGDVIPGDDAFYR